MPVIDGVLMPSGAGLLSMITHLFNYSDRAFGVTTAALTRNVSSSSCDKSNPDVLKLLRQRSTGKGFPKDPPRPLNTFKKNDWLWMDGFAIPSQLRFHIRCKEEFASILLLY